LASYLSDLSDAQWKLLEPLLIRPGKRGPKHGSDLRRVVDAVLYISSGPHCLFSVRRHRRGL